MESGFIKKSSLSKTSFSGVTVIVDVQDVFEVDIEEETKFYIDLYLNLAMRRKDLIITLELVDPYIKPTQIYTNKTITSQVISYSNYIIASKFNTSGLSTLREILLEIKFKQLTFFGGYISECLFSTVSDSINFFKPKNPIIIPINACFEALRKNRKSAINKLESLIPYVILV